MNTLTTNTDVIFGTTEAGMLKYEGLAVIVRPLVSRFPEDRYDDEVGPMYRIRTHTGEEIDAFDYELKRCWA